MMRSPRYFVGRRVLVRATVCARPTSASYMKLDEGAGKELTTHNATIVSSAGDAVVVEVAHSDGGVRQLSYSRGQLLALNQPHVLSKVRGAVVLEDGLRCKYSSLLAKAKMCEIALRLAPLIKGLNFADDPAATEETQLECVRCIRTCLDIVTFQRGLDRGRSCAMCDDAARFAVHGQGHCHTVSSVMCAFLYPWAPLLGLDLCYRGGYSFKDVNLDDASILDGEVADKPERHQWLEVSLRPRMRRFAVDLWVQDAHMGEAALRWPAEEAYQQRMYPHGQLQLGQTVAPPEESDWDLQ